jgi:hypothetical protein
MIGNMTERIGKCIVHHGIVYPFEDNKISFWKYMYGFKFKSNIFIFSGNGSGRTEVNSKDCLFIFEDDFEKYPEYFI